MITRAVNINGLSLDEDTATDGNCGVDALIRGMVRLDPDNVSVKMKHAIRLHDEDGQHVAIRWMREQIVPHDHEIRQFSEVLGIFKMLDMFLMT